MSKKIICICLCIVLILLMIYLVNLRNDKNSNDNLIISNNVPNINDEKDSILNKENCRFYSYQKNDQNYIVFKIWESTYTNSIKIESIELKNTNYNNKTLNVELNVKIKEGTTDPLRDWPLIDEKYIIMKVDNEIEKLYINGQEYKYID